jgi:hypothetical protein
MNDARVLGAWQQSERRGGRHAALLGVLAFWMALIAAIHHYPGAYDWRYMTISSLLYPDRDPQGYLWAWGGVVLCGLGGLWRAWELRGQRWLLRVGFIFMIACALWPPQALRLPKGHELLALTSFISLGAGIVQRTWSGTLGIVSRLQSAARARRWALGTCTLALLPIAGAGASQAYISYALPTLPWVGMVWRTRGIPISLSFAFWEWLTCALLSGYWLVLALLPVELVPREP